MLNAALNEDRFDPVAGIAETLDRLSFAWLAHATRGLSSATLAQAFADWVLHLASSPGKQLHLAAKAQRKLLRLADSSLTRPEDERRVSAITPLPQDHRFDDPLWSEWPFNLVSQSFLMHQQWWHAATTGVMGVSRHHEAVVEFTTRQFLDLLAPTNFIVTNPVLQKKIADTNGQCLIEGARLFAEDMQRLVRGAPPVGAENFRVGVDIAATRGKVVFRNDLIELLQYEPEGDTVRPEPILIVPAWIMKYYILDLSPENSLIKWLVSQGYTVFAISWRNPGRDDRNLGMDDYRRLGPVAAIDAIDAIVGGARIHALGYCLGGTLLAITAAALARDNDDRLASITLLAAQTEFSEPGELGLFIDEAQLNILDAMMWSHGYLDTAQMGGAFQLLRSNDLIWSHALGTYLMGERTPMTDMMAWNADGTRMPHAMHSEYLRSLFLDNQLAEGHYKVEGRAITLSALRVPIFVVGTESDHVAPWRSVYKIHALSGTEITFALANSGHNAGIISEPGHPHRHYRLLTRPAGDPALSPDEWTETAILHQGSWWTAWEQWLGERSGPKSAPPPLGNASRGYPVLAEAPGRYVLEQ